MTFCGKCGAKNPDDADYCFRCGGPLFKGEDAASGAPVEVPKEEPVREEPIVETVSQEPVKPAEDEAARKRQELIEKNLAKQKANTTLIFRLGAFVCIILTITLAVYGVFISEFDVDFGFMDVDATLYDVITADCDQSSIIAICMAFGLVLIGLSFITVGFSGIIGSVLIMVAFGLANEITWTAGDPINEVVASAYIDGNFGFFVGVVGFFLSIFVFYFANKAWHFNTDEKPTLFGYLAMLYTGKRDWNNNRFRNPFKEGCRPSNEFLRFRQRTGSDQSNHPVHPRYFSSVSAIASSKTNPTARSAMPSGISR